MNGHRLAAFRLLAGAGAQGVPAGEIAREIRVLPNTLSSHLNILSHAGLIGTIIGGQRARPDFTPNAVGLYIVAAYWFTASTSFANPAVTIARSLTDTFAGIAPVSVPLFIAAQLIGAATAVAFFAWLFE